ncbi:MAG: HIT domain-containing protein [Gammaproteobacteria bacterium]|nr:HIT domain-containing protein [Gammaproteobacteria bacterium]
MTSENKCSLCNVISGQRIFDIADKPFLESDTYIAIPSIGPLVEGWSMIVPKQHKLSLMHDYDSAEFIEFTTLVQKHISSIYGNTIMFEHGANHTGSLAGCGVDHAHFHIVPFQHSLIDDLNNSDLEWHSCRANDIPDQCKSMDYLFYCDEINSKNITGSLHIFENPTSQFFRNIIARKLGKIEVSDYKKYPNITSARKTYKNLAIA